MRRFLVIVLALSASLAAVSNAQELTLTQIMARDWIGTPPEHPRFGDEGRAIYYDKRRPGSDIVDLFRVEIATGKTTEVADRDRGAVDPPRAVWSRDRRIKAFV